MINSLVLGGGGYHGLITCGILEKLLCENNIKLSNIKYIFGTSIGSLIGVLCCLNIDFKIINEYFVNRPWEKTLELSGEILMNLYNKKGISSEYFFEVILKNIFYSKNLELSITLEELYNISKIELHIYTIEVSSFEVFDLSYKTHPNLGVIKAINMSCAIPYVFEPVLYENKFYIDGGILCNYPIERAINIVKDSSKILGIKIKRNSITNIEKLNIFEYAYFLHHQFCKKQREEQEYKLESEIIIDCDNMDVNDSFNVFFEKEVREKFLNIGYNKAKIFLEK